VQDVLFRGLEALSRSLEVLRGGLGKNKLQFLKKKKDFFSFTLKCKNFGHQNHGSGLALKANGIHNTACLSTYLGVFLVSLDPNPAFKTFNLRPVGNCVPGYAVNLNTVSIFYKSSTPSLLITVPQTTFRAITVLNEHKVSAPGVRLNKLTNYRTVVS
jgi:hypothetical protein